MKLEKVDNEKGGPDYQFWCEGCECYHGVWTTNKNGNKSIWEFNGNLDKPTFKPSIKVTWPYKDKINICHSYVKDGNIQYLNDCTHKLAGQTIELKDLNK